ncbi:MCP four helix bundle domain-containing protein [Lacibacter sediminis]|uniref:MCP four helix bundle domain-containing protein n=1 Tax=Lacibacter sediminis TaxID=2760713 RepID=A0A7G5XIW0_9BACT|nr:MCP four helix bundle domain-containing protein [Lacibacter sediminis]QNA45413.1 MCP four helix bundle domain-containing protein [Lacibacter sediminis]
MKQFISIREKRVAAAVLFVVLVAIGLNQLLYEKEYAQLDKNMSSLYKDRLMPAGYLFEISDHLYQKKILHMDEAVAAKDLVQQLKKHDDAIATLIKAYETTYLTKDEQQHWNYLLTSLEAYRRSEMNRISQVNSSASYDLQLDKNFQRAQAALGQLNALQAKEGSLLQRNSKAIIDDTVIQSYLQISMLIVLAVIGMILLLARDNPFFPGEKKAILN